MSAFPDEPFGPIDHVELDAVPLAVIRQEGITIAGLSEAFDSGYRAIAALFTDGTLVHAGPALAMYYGNPMEVFDLELGFPVATAPAQSIEANGLIVTASALPSGPAVATTVFGSYDDLGAGWAGLVERAAAEGAEPRGVWIEIYVSDPDDAPERLRTDLILPLG